MGYIWGSLDRYYHDMRRLVVTAALILLPFCGFSEILNGRVVGVTDGDTIMVLVNHQQYRVRLTEIDTPESGQPWGSRAKQALSDKVYGATAEVRSEGTDRYGRTLGRVYVRGRDVNREMVREGHAWVYRKYMTDESLLADQAHAKEKGLGLWGLPEAQHAPPWEWRRGARGARASGAPTTLQDFTCRGKRYCREMASCAEAMLYLRQCGLTRLDGDSDGVPCEAICP